MREGGAWPDYSTAAGRLQAVIVQNLGLTPMPPRCPRGGSRCHVVRCVTAILFGGPTMQHRRGRNMTAGVR